MTFLNWIQTKDYLGARWIKLVYHNSSNRVIFQKNEVKFTVSQQKYSILKYIDRIKKYDSSKYEFLLEYPGHEGFNRWTQNKNPLFSKPNEEIGYENISTTWTSANWGGLFLLGSHLIGSKYQYRQYCVCCTSFFGDGDEPTTFTGPGFYVLEVNLWMRVRNEGILFRERSLKCRRNRTNNLFLFLVLVSVK